MDSLYIIYKNLYIDIKRCKHAILKECLYKVNYFIQYSRKFDGLESEINIFYFYFKSHHTQLTITKTMICGGTGTDSTVPTNTIQVPITTGTVTDSGSECTGFIGDICRYIYRAGEL